MFPVGGVGAMLVGVALAGVVCGLLALGLARRTGLLAAVSIGALLWSLAVIGLITLLPASGPVDVVLAEDRLDGCSWDLGGPAPDAFWIFSGGQRLLNTVVFIPSGALLVVAAARWGRAAFATVPLGLGLLAAYSVAIEWTQLELARIDRACDVTDVVDNVTGAVLGVVVGVVLAMILRPWRSRD